MVTGPGHGLAFQLAAAGYDVWMGNFRGNTYSKGHIRDISDKEYWVLSIQNTGVSQEIIVMFRPSPGTSTPSTTSPPCWNTCWRQAGIFGF